MAADGKEEDKWTEHKDENGKTYYYNFARKQGVWEKPEGFQSEEQSTAGMEVEDSSEQEGFRPVAKAKRKKSTETKVDDGLVVKKLLDSNKFSPLAEKNKSNNNADPAGGKTEPVVPTYGRPPGGKKQPPLVVQNTSLSHLGKVLGKCEVQPDLKLTRTGIKLTCYSGDDFDTVQAHLKKHKVQFYTHGKRSDRAHRVVIRGLPDLQEEYVKSLLKEHHKLEVLAVYEIKRKQQLPAVIETPFIVLFPKGHTSLKELNSKVKNMGPIVVRWEAYRSKQPHVTQCKNCLQFGHGTINCHLKPKCGSCGGAHSTDSCKSEERQATKCANCSGPHEGLDRSCPKRVQFIQARQQASKPKPPAWKDNRTPTVPAFNTADFPPLPGPVPVVEQKQKHPRPAGSHQGQPHPGGNGQQHPRPAGTNRGPHPEGAKEEGEKLYSSAELWDILTEYVKRLRSCRTLLDQYAVVSYMACKFGVK